MTNRDFLLERMERFLRCRLAEETANKQERFHPSMTISRQCGAGMDRIERALIEYLDEVDDSTEMGWALFDQALVGKIISDHNLPVTVQPYLTENTKFLVVEALEVVLNLHPSEWTLFNYTADTIRKLCKLGNAVVVGRAGNFVTADLKNTFHVRLVGSEKKRIDYMADRYKISANEANKLVKESDKGRAKFVKRYTESEVGNADFYHVVINTDNLTDEVLVRVLADTLLEWASEKENALKKTEIIL